MGFEYYYGQRLLYQIINIIKSAGQITTYGCIMCSCRNENILTCKPVQTLMRYKYTISLEWVKEKNQNRLVEMILLTAERKKNLEQEFFFSCQGLNFLP